MRILILIVLSSFCLGCETLHTGPGYAVHDDKEAMDLAWASYEMKGYDLARNGAKGALKINPDNVDAYNLLGLIELKTGDLKKSIFYLERGRDILLKNNLPNGDYIFCKLGLAYFKNGEYEKALAAFKAARRINNVSGTEAQISMTLWQMGKLRDGLESMKQSKELGNTKENFLAFLNDFSIDPKDFEQLIRVLK